MPPVEAFHRVQQLQQLDHPASAVMRPCRQVPSSLAAGLAAQPRGGDDDGDHDDALGRLSDLAYGYRVTPRGLARRAASAGAMYPVELVWITHHAGRWVLRYFDPLRQGCADLGRPADRSAAALGLTPGRHAVLLIAVAWRTVQRYGVRGYRYCLLDAGHVLGNLSALAAAAGARPRLPAEVPYELLCAELGLARDELLLGVTVVDGEPGEAIPAPAGGTPVAAVEAPMLYGTEQPPLLAPAMERIRRLHAMAGPASQVPLDLAALLGARPAAGAIQDVLLRRSARSFLGTELDPASGAALAAYLQRVAETTPLAVRLVTRTAGRWSARRCDGGPADRRTAEPAAEPEAVSQPSRGALCSMFGDQPIAASASAFAVLGMPVGGGGLLEYRQALLAAGVACAGGYLLAARRGLATTVLGGFDDHRVSELAGGRIIPLVAQAFGPGEAGRDVKNDTVAATWLQTPGSAG
jgi:hypothetical protein